MSANDKAAKDMRKSERFDVTDIVRVIDVPTGQEIGRLVNISDTGMMIHGTRKIEENSVMQLSLVFEDDLDKRETINIGVESLWAQTSGDKSQYWTGFCIIDISEQDQARILKMTS